MKNKLFKTLHVAVSLSLLWSCSPQVAPYSGGVNFLAANPSAAPSSEPVLTGRTRIPESEITRSGREIKAKEVSIILPESMTESNRQFELYRYPKSGIQSDFKSETVLENAIEIQLPKQFAERSQEHFEVEYKIDISQVPESQRNTAQTYVLVWNGIEWEPVFGSVDTKSQELSFHLPAFQEQLKIVPVTSQQHEMVSVPVSSFSTQQVNSTINIKNILVVYTSSIVNNMTTIAESEERKRTNLLNDPDGPEKGLHNWCREAGGECIDREFRVVTSEQAKKVAQFAAEAFDFFITQGFKPPTKESLNIEDGNYVIFANGWEGGAKRSPDNRYFESYGIYSSRSKGFAIYLGASAIQSDNDLKSGIAHEFFHAFQHNYTKNTNFRLGQDLPIIEGTANAMAGWFMHGVPHTKGYPLKEESSEFIVKRGAPFPISEPFFLSKNMYFSYQMEQFWVYHSKKRPDLIKDLFEHITQRPQDRAEDLVENFFLTKYNNNGSLYGFGKAYSDFIDYLIKQSTSFTFDDPIKSSMIGGYIYQNKESYDSHKQITLEPYSSLLYFPISSTILPIEEDIRNSLRSTVELKKFRSKSFVISNTTRRRQSFSMPFSGEIFAGKNDGKNSYQGSQTFHFVFGDPPELTQSIDILFPEPEMPIAEFIRGNVVPSTTFCSDGEVKVVVTLLDQSGQIITSGIQPSNFNALLNQPAGSTATVQGLDVVQEGQQVDDGNITDAVLMIDDSGSMIGERLVQAKAAAKELVNQHSGRIAVYTFMGKLVDFTADKAVLSEAIDGIRATGGTPLYRTIQTILNDLGSGVTMVVLTDGEASDSSLKNATVALAQEKGSSLYTVGLGSAVNRTELESVASQTGGTYSSADVSTLVGVFQGIGQVIAGSAILTLGIQPSSPDTQYQGVIEVSNQGNRLNSEFAFRSPSLAACTTSQSGQKTTIGANKVMISGKISDISGAPLEQAAITATGPGYNKSVQTVAGSYLLPEVPVGITLSITVTYENKSQRFTHIVRPDPDGVGNNDHDFTL